MTIDGTIIKARIRRYIAESLLFSDGFTYEDDTSLLEEGIVDSLGVMELVMFVEQTFDVPVQDRDVTPDNFDSVNRLANYIQSHSPKSP